MKGISVLLLAIITLTGCRYEKGPVICVISAERRLEGNYALNELWINGENALQTIDTLPLNAHLVGFSKIKDPNSNSIFRGFGITDTIQRENLVSASWSFVDSKKNILRISNIPLYRAPIPGLINSEEIWIITKLSEKKLWMNMSMNGVNYEIRFKKLDPYQF